jgi:hypothetical protein
LQSGDTDIELISETHDICFEIGRSLKGSALLEKFDLQEVSKRTPEQPIRTRSYSATDAEDTTARVLFGGGGLCGDL